MEKESVELLIPFESLVSCVEKLSLKEKIRLWELLTFGASFLKMQM